MIDLLNGSYSAGATASSSTDWHAAWKSAPESVELEQELVDIHERGRRQPENAKEEHPEFAAAYGTQLSALLVRSFRVSNFALSKISYIYA